MAHDLGERCFTLARRLQDPALLLEAHFALSLILFSLGEFVLALEHAEQGIALYDPKQHAAHANLYGQDPGVTCQFLAAWSLEALGYPTQAQQRSRDALTLARQREHSHTLAVTLTVATMIAQFQRDARLTQEYAEESMTLSTDQGFAQWLAIGAIFRGWAITQQEQGEEGITQIQNGLAAHEATGGRFGQTNYLALLADAYRKTGQVKEGLTVLEEALTEARQTGELRYEAELYRLKGELLLAQEGKLRE